MSRLVEKVLSDAEVKMFADTVPSKERVPPENSTRPA
jgi:hypothetical protein